MTQDRHKPLKENITLLMSADIAMSSHCLQRLTTVDASVHQGCACCRPCIGPVSYTHLTLPTIYSV